MATFNFDGKLFIPTRILEKLDKLEKLEELEELEKKKEWCEEEEEKEEEKKELYKCERAVVCAYAFPPNFKETHNAYLDNYDVMITISYIILSKYSELKENILEAISTIPISLYEHKEIQLNPSDFCEKMMIISRDEEHIWFCRKTNDDETEIANVSSEFLRLY